MFKTAYEFSAEKNKVLIEERNISFEEIIAALASGQLLDVLQHPNPKKYPDQRIYVVRIYDYVYLVPFIEKDKNTVFLKTIFPSRKAKKQYLKNEVANEKKNEI